LNFANPIYNPEQQVKITALNSNDLDVIDQSLLKSISSVYFYKINRIVGGAMITEPLKSKYSLPDTFYAHRVFLLIDKYDLIYRGEFEFGKCEIRKQS